MMVDVREALEQLDERAGAPVDAAAALERVEARAGAVRRRRRFGAFAAAGAFVAGGVFMFGSLESDGNRAEVASDGGDAGTPALVDDRLVAEQIEGVRTGDDATLVFALVHGPEWAADDPCSSRIDATVEETVSTVTVRFAAFRSALAGGQDCPDIGFGRNVVVDLAEPLGSRTLYVDPGAAIVAVDGAALAVVDTPPAGMTSGIEHSLDGGAWSRTWELVDDGAETCDRASWMSLWEGTQPADAVPGSTAATDVGSADEPIPATVTVAEDGSQVTVSWSHAERFRVLSAPVPCAESADTIADDLVDFARTFTYE